MGRMNKKLAKTHFRSSTLGYYFLVSETTGIKKKKKEEEDEETLRNYLLKLHSIFKRKITITKSNEEAFIVHMECYSLQ